MAFAQLRKEKKTMAKKPTFQRARSDEQIVLRREEIIRIAHELLVENGPNGITLGAIGDGVGLSKSNLYRYFESREDVLCEVFLQESQNFVSEISSTFRSLSTKNDISLCAVLFAQACANHRFFSILNSQFAVNLEGNISSERLSEVKKRSGLLLMEGAKALRIALPKLGIEDATKAIRILLHQLAGAWPYMNPGSPASTAINSAEQDVFNTEFRQGFTESCYVILNGLFKDDHDIDTMVQ